MEKLRSDISPKAKIVRSIFFPLFLIIASFGFLSVYSYYSSPFFTADNGYDAGFFRLVGQGMTKGYLPYRDFFDMKGPYFFFIEYIAQLISYGRLGIFLVQWGNLFLMLFLICHIFQMHGIKSRCLQMILLLPVLYVSCFTFEGGNLTEEFSLVPLLFCLLLCFRHFLGNQDHCKPFDGFCYGICFGYLLLIRVTNAVLICAIVLVISVNLLMHKQYKNLLANALAFISGVIAISLPMVIFYGAHGLLDEMFEAVFVLGFKYSGEQSILEHLQQMIQGDTPQRLLLLIGPFVTGLIVKYPTWKERALLFTGCLFTFVGIAAGNNYTHYYALTIPLIVMAISAAARPIQGSGRNHYMRRIAAGLLLVAMLFPQFELVQKYTNIAKELTKYEHSFKNYEEIMDYIPPESRDSVFSYNINPCWYTYTDLFPCIKYCGWQNHYIDLMPEIAVEMEAIFQTDPPKWLVLPTKTAELPAFLETEINNNYQIAKTATSWLLLERK